jgi:Fe(3+) dicitrate transport protein
VRVIKGPAAISYGPQTVGGAIDLVTRPIPDGGAGSVDLGYGAYGYNKFHGFYGWSDEQTGFLIEGVHLGNSGFKELPSGADTGFFRNEWMLKTSRVLDPNATVRHEFRLKLTYSEEGSNESYLGLSDADFRANPRRRYAGSALDHMRWHRTAIVAEHEMQPTPKISITTSVYRNDFFRIWRKLNAFRGKNLFDLLKDADSPQNAVFMAVLRGEQDSTTPAENLLIGPNQREFVAQGVQTRVRIDTQNALFSQRIEYGMRLHYDRIERRHSEDGFAMVGGELVPEGSPTVVTVYNEAWTESLALHASDAISYRALTVTPGLRVELMRSALLDKAAGTRQAGTAQLALPGVGMYQGLSDELGLLLGVYRGASPPPPGNPEGQGPELSINYEAGVRHTKGRARAELIGFYNDYQNLTDVCTLSSGCLDANLDQQYDAGRARIYGLEAYFERDVRLGPFTLPLNASYTYTRARFSRTFSSDDPIFGDVHKDDDMPYVPRHQVNGTVGFETEKVAGHATFTYVSRMRERAGSGAFEPGLTTDEEFVVDLGLSHKPAPWLEVYATLNNALDAQPLVSRRPFGARPIAPRWAHLGAKASF